MEQAYCEALRAAFEFEHHGELFYRELINKAQDPFAKRVLRLLADEEVRHVRIIAAFNESLLGKGEFDFDTECNLELTDKIQTLVQEKMRVKDKQIDHESSDIDIYEVAMLLEKKSYEMYEQALSENQDEKVEIFFRFLLAQEREHYDLLASSKKYLEDPSYYFAEFGGWVFG